MKPSLELRQGTNICVVTAYDDAFTEVGDYTIPIKLAYCMKHKYDFRVYREGFDTSRHPSWSKILFIRETLKEYDWVFWIDADAVFTNHNIKVMDMVMLGGDFYICKEYHNMSTLFNMGVFLIRKSD
jgi:lipopolysaccharide biosynthesis glycosyltransferase